MVEYIILLFIATDDGGNIKKLLKYPFEEKLDICSYIKSYVGKRMCFSPHNLRILFCKYVSVLTISWILILIIGSKTR